MLSYCLTICGDGNLVRQVDSGVFALIVINVNRDFLGMERLAVNGFDALEIGGQDVLGLAGRNALGELAIVVGENLPADFLGLVDGAPDLYPYAVERAVVGSPDRAGDEGIGLVPILILALGPLGR